MIPREYFNPARNDINDSVLQNESCICLPSWTPYKECLKFHEKYELSEIIDSVAHYFFLEQCKIVFDSSGEGFNIYYMTIMDSLLRGLISKYNISVDSFMLITGCLPVQKNIDGYTRLCTRLKLIPIKIALVNKFEIRIQNSCSDLNLQLNTVIHKKNKKIVSFNGVPRAHRIFFTLLLMERNLLDSSYYSFGLNYENLSVDQAKNYITNYVLFPSMMERIQQLFNEYYISFPMTLTRPHNTCGHDMYVEDSAIFDDSYFLIIQETTYSELEANIEICYKESIFITEKTFRGFAYSIPFLILNRPYTLQALRDYGYKTFSPHVDETYDTIEDDQERMLAILREVERLCGLSDDEWRIIQTELMPIFKYNYDKLMSAKPTILLSNL